MHITALYFKNFKFSNKKGVKKKSHARAIYNDNIFYNNPAHNNSNMFCSTNSPIIGDETTL